MTIYHTFETSSVKQILTRSTQGELRCHVLIYRSRCTRRILVRLADCRGGHGTSCETENPDKMKVSAKEKNGRGPRVRIYSREKTNKIGPSTQPRLQHMAHLHSVIQGYPGKHPTTASVYRRKTLSMGTEAIFPALLQACWERGLMCGWCYSLSNQKAVQPTINFRPL